MDPFEVKAELSGMTILVDTREQDTKRSRQRLKSMGAPYERRKLNCGDYSVKCPRLDLAGEVVIERKMSLEELSQCFFQQRGRFQKEFERAKAAGTKMYLLIEDASLDAIYWHRYGTKASPQAFIATLFAWLARYNCQILFCSELTSGRVIHDILYRELKERLENLPEEVEEDGRADNIHQG